MVVSCGENMYVSVGGDKIYGMGHEVFINLEILQYIRTSFFCISFADAR